MLGLSYATLQNKLSFQYRESLKSWVRHWRHCATSNSDTREWKSNWNPAATPPSCLRAKFGSMSARLHATAVERSAARAGWTTITYIAFDKTSLHFSPSAMYYGYIQRGAAVVLDLLREVIMCQPKKKTTKQYISFVLERLSQKIVKSRKTKWEKERKRIKERERTVRGRKADRESERERERIKSWNGVAGVEGKWQKELNISMNY